VERIAIAPRENWEQKVEALGFIFHTAPDQPYWNEAAYYRFTSGEIKQLERATNELHEMCLQAVQHVIDHDRFAELHIPEAAVPWIKRTWEEEPPSLYGRFDFAFDGTGPPKLLEYNADTPTSLLEAAVIQWHWLQERFPEADQFNSIWEGFSELWTELRTERYLKGPAVHFGHVQTVEDLMTVTGLRDAAEQAGIATIGIHMDEIGWDEQNRWFVDANNIRIRTIFKLYPWEWILDEPFGSQVLESLDHTQWIEPIWKLILSSKGILALLWELYPSSPYLVGAHIGGPAAMKDYVKKPLSGREGEEVTIVRDGVVEFTTATEEGESQPFVYQQICTIPNFDGNRPVIGSWVVDAVSRGIGIRETDGPVTDDLARFVPHLFV
jgi:glutathionylspermidine synthase